VAHEVLEVESVVTSSQTATVKRHHTMYVHVVLTPTVSTQAGMVTVEARLVRWDDGSPITDPAEARELSFLVDGNHVLTDTTVAGTVRVTLAFSDPGTYTVQVEHTTVNGAAIEVTV
jgi:hypothetical protein